ncbi:NAD-dependent epimerase/dehydratase family protein [Rhodocaloribacter sp.]
MEPDVRTVLVTGGCGYLGSRLIRDLAADPRFETRVRILDNMQNENYRALMGLPEQGRFEFIEGDVLDRATLKLALRDVDAVVHLAAVVRTPMSFDQPRWVQQVNHWGTVSLAEMCLEQGVRRFVYAGSAAVYGPGGPFTEADVCRPQGAYAQSKRQAEEALASAAERGLRPTSLRFATLFGLAPVMRFDAVANRFAYMAGTRRKVTVYGDGKQRRSFVHVRDASAAVRFSLAHGDLTEGKTLNVVGESRSILELAEDVVLIHPETSVHFTEQDIRTHLNLEIDGSAIRKLGWHPRHTLREGLGALIDQFAGVHRPDIFLHTFE